ncbi:hypothetical protein DPEC_G00320080 [Dallia pectoralis]|uniref:Uncharacterized protein n=1 Tax=Dallia pectoralis TaxID=75939 RepID=A0ACC2F9S7_DALPE|nr:hypothetical protein DPEC_G00320080 [Dallia pectoralis]
MGPRGMQVVRTKALSSPELGPHQPASTQPRPVMDPNGRMDVGPARFRGPVQGRPPAGRTRMDKRTEGLRGVLELETSQQLRPANKRLGLLLIDMRNAHGYQAMLLKPEYDTGGVLFYG